MWKKIDDRLCRSAAISSELTKVLPSSEPLWLHISGLDSDVPEARFLTMQGLVDVYNYML